MMTMGHYLNIILHTYALKISFAPKVSHSLLLSLIKKNKKQVILSVLCLPDFVIPHVA